MEEDLPKILKNHILVTQDQNPEYGSLYTVDAEVIYYKMLIRENTYFENFIFHVKLLLF